MEYLNFFSYWRANKSQSCLGTFFTFLLTSFIFYFSVLYLALSTPMIFLKKSPEKLEYKSYRRHLRIFLLSWGSSGTLPDCRWRGRTRCSGWSGRSRRSLSSDRSWNSQVENLKKVFIIIFSLKGSLKCSLVLKSVSMLLKGFFIVKISQKSASFLFNMHCFLFLKIYQFFFPFRIFSSVFL